MRNKLHTKIKIWLSTYTSNSKTLKTTGGLEVGTPDLLVSFQLLYNDTVITRVLFLELKQKGEKVSAIQRQRLIEWGNAGMYTAIIRSLDGFERFFVTILSEETGGFFGDF